VVGVGWVRRRRTRTRTRERGEGIRRGGWRIMVA
jgi:hypothetical protein